MFTILFSVVAVGLLCITVEAHSWNEQLSLVGDNGSFVANGYPRAYKARTDPGYDGNSMMWMIPGAETQRIHINDQDLLCHTSQRNPTQSPNYPRLAVAPGSAIAMKYLENGHVTLPQNQPGKQEKGGTVFVFGTSQPQTDEKLADVLRWTSDGSGGDKRGRLLQAQNFDDGRCHQINGGPISTQRQQEFPNLVPGQATGHNELWCESNAIIPKDVSVGKPYTIYWVWQWPTMPGQENGYPQGKDEYYTTCNDLDVQSQAPQTGRFANTLKQQDPQGKPVQEYLSRSALETVPWPKGVAGADEAPSSAAVSAPASTAPISNSQSPVVISVAPAVPTTAPVQASSSSMIQQGPSVTPLPLSAFISMTSQSATASLPSVASASPALTSTATNASPSSTFAAAKGGTESTGGSSVITVPAGASLFVLASGSFSPVVKRAMVTPNADAAAIGATAAATHSIVHLHPRQFRTSGLQRRRSGGYEG